MNYTLYFAVKKETKGAVQYEEVNADGSPAFDPKVGTLYVRKSAMGGAIRKQVTATITLN